MRMELAEQKIAVLEPAYQDLADECAALREAAAAPAEEKPAEETVEEEHPEAAEVPEGPAEESEDVVEVPEEPSEEVVELSVEESDEVTFEEESSEAAEAPVATADEGTGAPVGESVQEEAAEESEEVVEVPEGPAESGVELTVEESAEDAEEDPLKQGSYLSRESIDTINRVRAMKDAKIDEWLAICESGGASMDVCDDIVHFLKTDVALCDTILGIDFRDRRSVVEGFRGIIEIATESKDPDSESQRIYVESLSEEECSLEYSFSRVINSLQGMLMYMKDELLD